MLLFAHSENLRVQVPDQIRCYNRVVVDGIEALCIFLKGFTYPC